MSTAQVTEQNAGVQTLPDEDRFVSFIAALTAALDDHDTRGAELAARLHLSRYHLDRIISSTVGEPPGALRRRILLERSAYRLITTEQPVLDIAVEAGYSSQAAYTRAFTRAY